METNNNEIIYTVSPAGVDNFPREFKRSRHEDKEFNALYRDRMYIINKNRFREKLFIWGIESVDPKEGVSYASAIVDYFVSQLPADIRRRYNEPAKSLDAMLDLLKEVLEPEGFVSDISVCHWLQANLPITDAFGKGAFKINGVIYSNKEVTVAGWLALIVCAMFVEARRHSKESHFRWIQNQRIRKV